MGGNMSHDRKEIPEESCRPDPTFNQVPTGHKIPDGRSADDPGMAFKVHDCGVKAGGQFSTPFVLDEEDLPTDNDSKTRQGY
jgi:hypothetical protein